MSQGAAVCRSEDSLLVVVDIQERLAAAMPDADLGSCLQSTSILLRAAVHLDIPVLGSEQYPQGLGETLPQIRQHYPASTSWTSKTAFSCCGADAFRDTLQRMQRGQVVLCGMESHVCVLQTALDLQQLGLQVFVAEDAVCARSRQRTLNALARLRQAGVTVTHCESVLFEWLRDAQHPQFKVISTLIKEMAN
jgi:nicotinamidase-related amidase